MDREEAFEQLLSSTPQLDDDGFTEALMQRLPPRRKFWDLRSTVLLGSAAVAGGIVAAVPGARQVLIEGGVGFAGGSVVAGLSLFSVAAIGMLLVWGVIAAATSET